MHTLMDADGRIDHVRIAFLLFGVTTNQDACYRKLTELGDELLLVFPESMQDMHFDGGAEFGDYAQTLVWQQLPDAATLTRLVDSFAPDAIVMSSWVGDGYRKAMAAQRGRALRILFTSNVWRATPKQWLGRAAHRFYIDPLYDCAYVAGDRSEWFARRLGFSAADIIRGSQSANVVTFDRGPRDPSELASRRRFLFSGRLVEHKAVPVLAEAYARYRRGTSREPWDLSVAGTGPLASVLEGIDGVKLHGFLQPRELSDAMHESSCFLLPSILDYYGLVVHESATAGLPLLCSDGVGAVPSLLQDGFNGWTVEAGNVASLASAMERMANLPEERLAAMSEGSRALASRLNPTIWARNLHEEIERRLPVGR
jgi:glycosyltransferase involved in cell wall biosynthesis